MPESPQPLRFEDGALFVLDQRLLPAQERWVRCESPAEVADCIRTLAVRGAPAIGIAAAYGLALAEDRRAAAELLRATRPTAVNLGWAIDRVLEAPDALERARELQREQEAADRRLAELGAARFEPGERALTHCNAGALATAGYGTAGGVLRAAWEQGRLREVWVDETRPLLQGARLTAYELGKAGIPYRLVTDSSAGTLMARGLVDRIVVGADRIAANGDVANKVGTYPLAVLARGLADAVVVGADRIAANGDVINKVGTYPLALAAARAGIPFVVVAPESTVDPATASGDEIEVETRHADEVLHVGGHPVAPVGASALNLAFDITPRDLVTAIVTEAGVLDPPYEESIARVTAR